MCRKPTHTEQEEQHFTELALRLIDLVDAKTRAIVADKIAGYPTAPAAVRQRLLKEFISIEASRTGQRARPPLAGGDKAPADELSELFFAANAEERRLILLNLPYAPITPAEPIAPAIARESDPSPGGRGARAQQRAVRPRARARSSHLARARAPPIRRRARASRSWSRPWRSACRPTVLQRILLCLNPAISQSVQRVYELALLHEEIEAARSAASVAIWQASHPAEKKTRRAAPPSISRNTGSDETSERREPHCR